MPLLIQPSSAGKLGDQKAYFNLTPINIYYIHRPHSRARRLVANGLTTL